MPPVRPTLKKSKRARRGFAAVGKVLRGADRVAVLVSGGMDSAVLLDWACARFRRVMPVYIRCGMRWEDAELHWLRKFLDRAKWRGTATCAALTVLHCPVRDLYGEHWSVSASRRVPGYCSEDASVFLPGRNLLLFSKAAVLCYMRCVGNIALGTLKGNPFADARPTFFRAFEKSCAAALGLRLKVWAPFCGMAKESVLRMGRHLPLELTFSCLRPRGRAHCGACNKCAERARGFKSIVGKASLT